MTYEELKQREPFFGYWYLGECIGSGSFGDVYEITRTEVNGEVYHAALKIISFPRNSRELEEVSFSQGTVENTFAYYDDMRNNFLSEISLMESFKGRTNIVSYEDHIIIPRKGGNEPGYDIFIRMELLTDLKTMILRNHSLCQNEREVAKIGMDICEALKLCHGQNPAIIHRDIKPGNIFCTQDGAYKLGDFGIARKMDDSGLQMSVKGTYEYMAPEVYLRTNYDHRADIYSLGMVLYRIMNGTREPFLATGQKITAMAKEQALIRRMQGEELENPIYASDRFSRILKKACAFQKEDRYQSASEFQDALRAIYEGREDEEPDTIPYVPPVVPDGKKKKKPVKVTPPAPPVDDLEGDSTIYLPPDGNDLNTLVGKKEKDKKKSKLWIALIPLVLVAGVIGMLFLKQDKDPQKQNTTQKPPVTTVANTDSESEKSSVTAAPSVTEETNAMEASAGSSAEEGKVEEEPEPVEPAAGEEIMVYGPYEEDEMAADCFIGDSAQDLVLEGTFLAQDENGDTVEVDGTLAFDGVETIDESGEYPWIFTPEDTERYLPVRGTVYITAALPQSEPYMSEKVRVYGKRREGVSNRLIFQGDSAEELVFTGAFQVSEEDSTEVTGTYAILDEEVINASGTYTWVFTPDDEETYLPVTGTVNITAMIPDTVTGVDAVKAVANPKELYAVDISGQKLKTLNILKDATNLRVLDAGNNNLTDITGIDGCTRLEYLSLYGNEKLKNVDVLLNKWYLIGVSLSDTQVSQKVQNQIQEICEMTTKERNAKANGE